MKELTLTLKKIKFNQAELQIVKRFQENPQGPHFLPLCEILKDRGYDNEAMELLVWGEQAFPNHVSAKVSLAQEYFKRGLPAECLQVLETSPSLLTSNICAQTLILQSAILLQEERKIWQAYHNLKQQNALSEEIEKIAQCFLVEGMKRAKNKLMMDLKNRNIHPVDSFKVEKDFEPGKAKKKINFEFDKNLDGYQVLQADDVFKNYDRYFLREEKLSKEQTREKKVFSPSLALADVYEKQGHFSQAMTILQKLQKIAPSDPQVKSKLLDLKKIIHSSREEELLNQDRNLLEKIESVQMTEERINVLNLLLERLNSWQEKKQQSPLKIH